MIPGTPSLWNVESMVTQKHHLFQHNFRYWKVPRSENVKPKKMWKTHGENHSENDRFIHGGFSTSVLQ